MSGAGEQGNEILIVEDDPCVLEVILMVLAEAGYRAVGVHTANEGLESIEALPETRVVMTDVNLHDRINGIEMAREMRRRGATASIVVMSAELRESIAPLDPDMRFLAKPCDRKTLLGAVEASMR